jgi:hypothetical protein
VIPTRKLSAWNLGLIIIRIWSIIDPKVQDTREVMAMLPRTPVVICFFVFFVKVIVPPCRVSARTFILGWRTRGSNTSWRKRERLEKGRGLILSSRLFARRLIFLDRWWWTHDGGVFGDWLFVLFEVGFKHVLFLFHFLFDFLVEVFVLLEVALSYLFIFAHN